VSVERIRGRKGRRIRERHFRVNPLCVHCLKAGITRLATQLDHIKPLSQGGQESEDNRQGLCDDCHEVKTMLESGRRPADRIGLDGFPIPRG
jgi:5-methylcytosine-specific restriction protein A